MKQTFFMLIAVLFTAQTYGQKYDFLTLLNSFPPVPDNVLASNKEKELYQDKLMRVIEQVSEYKSEFNNIEEKEITAADYDKLEPILKEYESIYDRKIGVVLERMTEKWADLHIKGLEEIGSLDLANEPYYQQIRAIIKKPVNAENEQLKTNLQKNIYKTKLALYPKLHKNMSDFLKEMLEEFKMLAPDVKKLDDMSLNTIKMKTQGVGPTLLEFYLKALEDAFMSHLGPFEESIKSDWEAQHYWAP